MGSVFMNVLSLFSFWASGKLSYPDIFVRLPLCCVLFGFDGFKLLLPETIEFKCSWSSVSLLKLLSFWTIIGATIGLW